jgi:hypothetical protein
MGPEFALMATREIALKVQFLPRTVQHGPERCGPEHMLATIRIKPF